VIAALLLGACPPEPGRVPAVRLAGARITGTIDVSQGDVGVLLELTACSLDCPPDFDSTMCRPVRLVRCALPGFTGKLLRARGSVRFESCAVSGCIVLRNASVEGNLHLSGSHLACAGRQALSAGGITVGGALWARWGLRVEGNVRLIGGTFNGGLFLDGAQLSNPGGDTITGDGITVRSQADLSQTVHTGTLSLRGARFGSLSLQGAALRRPGGYALHADHLEVATYLDGTGLRADGEVCLNDAHIGTILDLKGAHLHNPGGSSLTALGIRADGVMNCCEGFDSIGEIELYHARIGQHLCFEGARLSNPAGLALWAEQVQARELMLQTAQPADGTIDLRDAQIGVLHDNQATWPAALRLEGLSYDSLDPPLTGRQRLSWLRRDRSGHIPRAHEQLSAMYRRLGQGEEARAIQLAKQRQRRQSLPVIPRAWGYLQDWTTGYGYRPLRAAAGLLLLWAIGAVVFSVHHPPPAAGADPRTFQAPIYTLGLLLPVIDFQEENAFTPQGPQAWLAFALIAAGWILATTVAAGIVRALRGEGA